MPNFGLTGGPSPNVVNPAVTPTWIWTAPPVTGASVRIWNPGTKTAYVGLSQMTQNNSLPIPPGNRPIELQNAVGPLYALSGVTIGAQAGTVTASAVTVGTTAITLTAAVPANLAAGTTIVVGSTAGTGWEAQVVATTTASSQLTFTSALVQDHNASSPVYLATMVPAQLVVYAGVV